jgi:5S rRNA maturation endonuclease (ribonuclease M5)
VAIDVADVVRRLGIDAEPHRDGRLWALCPYHNDHKPSWSIDAKTGLHHCFSCDKGGDIYALVMSSIGISFPGAKDFVHIVPEEEKSIPVKVTFKPVRAVKRAFDFPPGVTFEPLHEWITPARGYAQERALTSEQVDLWGIGYACEGRLAGRIVIPIRDTTARLLNYSARSFVGDDRRYLMAEHRENPDPGAIFGELRWDHERKLLLLFEGALKALAVNRLFPAINFGTLSGSNVTPSQLLKLATFDRVIVVTDPDASGTKAWKKLHAALARHVNVERAAREPGPDLDELCPDALGSLVETWLT